MAPPDQRLAAHAAADLVQAFHRHRPGTVRGALEAMGPLAARRAPARVPRHHLDDAAGRLPALLADAAAVAIDDAVPVEDLEAWGRRLDEDPSLGHRIDAGRILGAAWFAAVATVAEPVARAEAYQRAQRVGAREIAQVAADLTERCLGLTATLLGGPARVRPGFAGPGIVEFAGAGALGQDGDAHVDWEGLAADDPAGLFDEAYSFVLMVRPPEGGGDLRVWGIGAAPESGGVGDPGPGTLVGYRAGTLVAFPAQDVHQITEMTGTRSRITVTWHARRAGDGWELWL